MLSGIYVGRQKQGSTEAASAERTGKMLSLLHFLILSPLFALVKFPEFFVIEIQECESLAKSLNRGAVRRGGLGREHS
jgi:hypothetical protein